MNIKACANGFSSFLLFVVILVLLYALADPCQSQV
jgi:hypothetical protein